MLHTKANFGSGVENFEEIYLIYAWQPFLVCDLVHIVNLHDLI